MDGLSILDLMMRGGAAGVSLILAATLLRRARASSIARVRVTAHSVVREGCGSGHGIGVDLGEAHESAIKEAETDAMKRALMTFGNPFGLALYDKSRANVGADGAPTSGAISSEEAIALEDRIKALGADRNALLQYYQVDGPHQLTPKQLASAHASLDKKEAAARESEAA
ncbi:MAG: RAD52 family DNA repair protein [Alphaproteobacteria bacterium]|nr:RAD52 family DNA repair protein [Alphaproteobacteria bacterium]